MIERVGFLIEKRAGRFEEIRSGEKLDTVDRRSN